MVDQEQVYNANGNIIRATRLGPIAIVHFSITMPDTTERTLTLDLDWAPASGFTLPLLRNGIAAGASWLSNNGAKSTLTYKAAQNNYGSYTCSTVYYLLNK